MAVTGAIAGAVSVRPKLAGAAAGVMGSIQIGSGAIGSWAAAALLAAFGTVGPLVLAMVVSGLVAYALSIWVRHARS
jgi:DHA1 family bicyclomycin/chloramphenicol resistance-like MFS transporter